MQKTTIHPKWEEVIGNQPINWFLYCTGKYTDKGQQDILTKLNIQRRHLGWCATQDGYVRIANPIHNIAIIYPELDPWAEYSYPEKNILQFAFELQYGNGIDIVGPALYWLQQALFKERKQFKQNPIFAQIGINAIKAKNLYLTP